MKTIQQFLIELEAFSDRWEKEHLDFYFKAKAELSPAAFKDYFESEEVFQQQIDRIKQQRQILRVINKKLIESTDSRDN